MLRAYDEINLLILNKLLEAADTNVHLRLRVDGHYSHRPTGDAAVVVDPLRRRIRTLLPPIPGIGQGAGKFALMADDNWRTARGLCQDPRGEG